MADNRHLKKQKIAISSPQCMTNFNEIWHSNASWLSKAHQPIKFLNFKTLRWRQWPSLKMKNLQYLHKRLTDFDYIWNGEASLHSGPHGQ